MMKNSVYVLIPVLLLAGACGGSGGSGVSGGSNAVVFPFATQEEIGGAVEAVYVEADANNEDKFESVTIDSVAVGGAFDADNIIDGYFNNDDGNFKYIFTRTTSSGEAGSAVFADDFDGGAYTGPSNFAIVDYRTTLGTALPTTGSATYNGFYTGVVRDATGTGPAPDSDVVGSMTSYITGDAVLTAYFDSPMQVNGSITNRQEYSQFDGVAFREVAGDVTFETGDLALDGTYSGTTLGGNLEYLEGMLPAVETVSGTYGGAIGGATGGETAGYVIINHDYANGNSFVETGGFVGE